MVIYLQVARILQALIFITRSHSFFFMERPSVALFLAFCLAQLISSIIAAYGDWGFSDVQGVSSSVSAQLPVVPAINALYDTIFSFGDSYTTNGYDPSKGITNIPDVGGTSSGGSSWPTFLANAAPPVKIELYNFAVGGAATNNTALYLAGQPHTIPDFPQQFDTFKQYFAQPGGIATSNGTVTWQSNRTLFTVFFGINDVGLEVRNGEDRRIELPQIFGTWSNIFSQLYTLGARNFLILSIPPTQRTPFISGLPPDVRALYESDLSAQNEALSNFVGTIESAYSGSKVTFFDTQPVFADILDNYQSYGFKDNSTYCDIYASISTQPALFLPQCGIPLAQYVWWNSGHPSWPVHQILASKIAEALLDDGVASSTGNTTNATSSTEVSIVNSSSATSTTSSSSFGWFANIITSLFPGLASGS
ncbi:hypothetical protein B0A53_05371 [Rhodotorula sp. CCFEE 5036]|nr:hypothetical protein B0A53_05371 [Rhodotorula sp. CCFEE 5036]